MTTSTLYRLPPALTPREKGLAAALLALALAAWLAPALSPGGWDTLHYVDTRLLWGLPNGADVLSNLPFVLMGVWGLAALYTRRRHAAWVQAPAPAGAAWFFAGLIVTCAGSSWYHLHLDVPHLIGDRAGMALAFAGVLGIAADQGISARAGRALVVLTAAAGLLAAWVARENLMPWAVVQFGGMALVLALALVRSRPGALVIPLGGVIVFYVLAKLAEMGDGVVFELTHHLVSGHTLKHLLAALAAWPVIRALKTDSIA